MVCTNCGADGATGVHRLRFESRHRESKQLELALCETCLGEMLEEEGIEMVATKPRATVE